MLTNFLELRVEKLEMDPPLRSVCAGYERDEWRASELARYLIRDCLLDFALTYDEIERVDAANAGRRLAEAASWLYSTTNFASRGEIGELLLHVILKQFYDTRSVVAKVYFKDSRNDTVKGFDSVHVSGSGRATQLWLGEVKYYTDIDQAIREVTQELQKHLEFDYLRAEFTAIRRKLRASAEDEELILALTEPNASLDGIVDRICVPVLLTYESTVMNSYTRISEDFRVAIEEEALKIHERFKGKLPAITLRIHLCLLPLQNKQRLSEHFNEVLLACQALN